MLKGILASFLHQINKQANQIVLHTGDLEEFLKILPYLLHEGDIYKILAFSDKPLD